MSRKPPRKCYKIKNTYTAFDLMLASTQPMAAAQREQYIQGFSDGLHAIQFEQVSTPAHWRIMADAVNLVETFCAHPWPDPECAGRMIDIADESGALQAASAAMKEAARLHNLQGGSIRLSASGREALSDLVELLDAILQTVSHRSSLQCHNECNTALKKHRALNRPDLTSH